MKRKSVAAGVVLLVAGLVWYVVLVARMGDVDRANASGYGQFVLAAIGLLFLVVPPAVEYLRAEAPVLDIEELTDRFAVAVRAQWVAAAGDRGLLYPQPLPIRWRRCAEPVAGPVGAATAPQGKFAALPGLERTTPAHLREGTHRVLHRVYGGLASGRLVITGGAGTGKSSAAILLLLDALNFREHTAAGDRAQVPVPVLFTLQGWDPENTPVHEWLVTKLTELDLFANRRDDADRLLRADRVAVFLDGLDEIPEPHRPAALRALAQQATCRLVLVTRTRELVDAAEHHILTGAAALELQPLTASDAATYLRQNLPEPTPQRWENLLDTLRGGTPNPVARALDNPLTITLLRDVYHPAPAAGSAAGSLDDLLDTTRFATPEDITHHLLDQAIATAYAGKPGQPRPKYTAEVAHRTLTLLATEMQNRDTRDFAWWQASTWARPEPRALVTAVVLALITLPSGVVALLVSGRSVLLFTTVFTAFLTGAVFGYRVSSRPTRFGRFRLVSLRRALLVGVAYGILGLVLGTVAVNLRFGLVFGPVFGLFAAGVLLLAVGTSVRGPIAAGRPRDQRWADLFYWLVVVVSWGLVVGVSAGLFFAFGDFALVFWGPESVFWSRMGIGLWLGLEISLFCGLARSKVWQAGIGQVMLFAEYRTPIRLGRFLEEAHERHLLRTVGAVYQFRHATLQDRLALPRQAPVGEPAPVG